MIDTIIKNRTDFLVGLPDEGGKDAWSDRSKQDELCLPIGQVKLQFPLN